MRQSLIAAGMFLLTGGMVGCGTSSTQEKEDLIVVDVSKDYPKKELILQDLFDVEYIPLETTDEFVTLGWLQAIGKDVMIIRNMWAVDGDIFIYDRKGKAIRHINRKRAGERGVCQQRAVSIWMTRKGRYSWGIGPMAVCWSMICTAISSDVLSSMGTGLRILALFIPCMISTMSISSSRIPIVDAHSISRPRRRTWSLEICSSSYPSKTGASRKR